VNFPILLSLQRLLAAVSRGEFSFDPRATIAARNPSLIFCLEAELDHLEIEASIECHDRLIKRQFVIELVSFLNVLSDDVFRDFPHANVTAFVNATASGCQSIAVCHRQVACDFAC
jgi:hypothetical protein